jgi:hypothetical protein
VPHQQIRGSSVNRDLILGDAMIAVQRRFVRVSDDGAADCDCALLGDANDRCVIGGRRAAGGEHGHRASCNEAKRNA